MAAQHPSPADRTTVPVDYLFSFTAQLVPPQVIAAGPQGTRVIIGVTGGTFTGPKLRGVEDGALILMTYHGINAAGADGTPVIRTAPLFETGDERYAWLNRVQAVGFGSVVMGAAGPESVSYDVYALQ